MSEFNTLRDQLRLFAEERDWDQFHTPKNLLMALTGEVGELCEQFQWLTDAESKTLDGHLREDVADEIADVQIYLIRLADKLDIDIAGAVTEKMAKNAAKYPADQVRGSRKKYTEYQ